MSDIVDESGQTGDSLDAPVDDSVQQFRRAGLLLHPTSLPSGKLDDDVERWLQMMADTGFSIWQVLPLCEPQSGLSPYQCSSTFAINPALLAEIPASNTEASGYIDFCAQQQFWLDDYALFKVLKVRFQGAAWYQWPDEWKYREPQQLEQVSRQYSDELTQIKWQQYQLFRRWQEIKIRAADLGILLFGDLPIFVGHDSADVWAHPEWFLLGKDGLPEYVTGVPPDYFSETGQRWGNPHYDWEVMQADDFIWWKARIRHHLLQFDLLRIDHFRGLEAVWMIDAACETAVDGHWQQVPGDALLASLSRESSTSRLPFIAEDLGIITPEVTALRKKYHLPGMSILQFGFDAFDDNPHKLKNITQDKVVYTGTHDNDTTKGWFISLDESVKDQVLEILQIVTEKDSDSPDVADMVDEKMITDAMLSNAETCIIPMQDLLHLGSEARMNTPGTVIDNWSWQFTWSLLETAKQKQYLKEIHRLIEQADRIRS